MIKEITTIASVAMPIEERWNVRRCRYSSPEGGKRLCIATGIHGDEIMGQLVVYDLVLRLQEHPECLHGIVDVYPMINPLGLDIGERMVPSTTRLDMNRAFPGSMTGTALEGMCYKVVQDMSGADLVLDVHGSVQHKSELFEIRVNAFDKERMIEEAKTLCPDIIWVYPDKSGYSASLSGALVESGTPALLLETDERRRRPQEIALHVTECILYKMREMGMWDGEVNTAPREETIIVEDQADILRLTVETPGIYVPQDLLGTWVEPGQKLGEVIHALEGKALQEVLSPCRGFVFSQRSYSAVYPGTMIARLYKRHEQA